MEEAEKPSMPEATSVTEQTRTNGRWAKGTSGNPTGRPRGSRNRATLIMEAILEDGGARLIQKLISMAMDGHPGAMRHCVERLLPRMRERSVDLELPATDTTEGVSAAIDAIVAAVAKGQLTPRRASNCPGFSRSRSTFVVFSYAWSSPPRSRRF